MRIEVGVPFLKGFPFPGERGVKIAENSRETGRRFPGRKPYIEVSKDCSHQIKIYLFID